MIKTDGNQRLVLSLIDLPLIYSTPYQNRNGTVTPETVFGSLAKHPMRDQYHWKVS